MNPVEFIDLHNSQQRFDDEIQFKNYLSLQNPSALNLINDQVKKQGYVIFGSGEKIAIAEHSDNTVSGDTDTSMLMLTLKI